jgi:DNA-binding IclR family transcriptional regulator
VVQRVAAILKAFSPKRTEWKLTPLAEATGLSKSTAHRLLSALESEGFTAYDPADHVYRLGPACVALGLSALPGSDLRAMAHPLLESLARTTGETCTLEMLVDRQVLIVAEVSGDHLVSATGSVGTRWPLHATSSGKAVLAAMPADRRSASLEPTLAALTPATIVDRRRLQAELDRAAERGFATATDELEIGYAAASAAVLAGPGEPLAALSVGGPSSRLVRERLDEIGSQLAAAAVELSARCSG